MIGFLPHARGIVQVLLKLEVMKIICAGRAFAKVTRFLLKAHRHACAHWVGKLTPIARPEKLPRQYTLDSSYSPVMLITYTIFSSLHAMTMSPSIGNRP